MPPSVYLAYNYVINVNKPSSALTLLCITQWEGTTMYTEQTYKLAFF